MFFKATERPKPEAAVVQPPAAKVTPSSAEPVPAKGTEIFRVLHSFRVFSFT